MTVNIIISGIVQGVGFRPFCYRIASHLGIKGWVRNSYKGVEITAAADKGAIEQFIDTIKTSPPPLARIEAIKIITLQDKTDILNNSYLNNDNNSNRFMILEGSGDKDGNIHNNSSALIPPDIAICHDCIADITDRKNRRYRYAFTTCTNCGPRFTIVTGLPYERRRTIMTQFSMCPDCLKEYRAPDNRRYHAETIACKKCGPAVQFYNFRQVDPHQYAQDVVSYDMEAVKDASRALSQGRIIAIKGIGGFHLACDALNEEAVGRIRKIKSRPFKPIAVMAKDVNIIKKYALINRSEEEAMASNEAPILLLYIKEGMKGLLSRLAGPFNTIGVMLPYSPLHYLLFNNEPSLSLLVMTSANKRGEPLITKEEDISLQFSPLTNNRNTPAEVTLDLTIDGVLTHNRSIARACDDSVVYVEDTPAPKAKDDKLNIQAAFMPRIRVIRRARGYVPCPIALKMELPQMAAFGGDIKNAIALSRGRGIFLSQYIGDLDNIAIEKRLISTLNDLCRLLDIAPDAAIIDLHPDYISSRIGNEYARQRSIPILKVQHHHAHIASVMAEHNIMPPVIGCALDGAGYGEDRTIWGGEVLLLDNKMSLKRIGHIEQFMMPGADMASKEPWRMALSLLYLALDGNVKEIKDIFKDYILNALIEQYRFIRCSVKCQSNIRNITQTNILSSDYLFDIIVNMLKNGTNSPLSSSAGRLFDGISAMLGICLINTFEGQAAMGLEALCYNISHKDMPSAHYPVKIRKVSGVYNILIKDMIISIIRDIKDGVKSQIIAFKFHQWLASSFIEILYNASKEHGITDIVLSGGVFQNRLLLKRFADEFYNNLTSLNLYYNNLVPTNDGGIAAGQAFIGAYLQHKSCVTKLSIGL